MIKAKSLHTWLDINTRLKDHSLKVVASLVVFAGLLVFGALLIGVQPPLTKAATTTQTVTLTPTGDSYVDSSLNTTNYGSANPLYASASVRRALLKFNTTLPSGAVVSSASLKLYSTSTASSGGFEVHPETDAWAESTVTWSTQPAWNATILGTSTTPTSGAWVSVSLPVSAVSTVGNTNFGLRFSTSGINAKFASREDASNKPQLIITYTSSATTPTPTPTIPAGSDPVIATAGDISCPSNTEGTTTCRQKSTAALVSAVKPTAVLVLGDNQYNAGTLSEYNTYYSTTWGAFKAITHPAIGNHENTGTGYYDYFNGVGVQTGPAGVRGKGWYSFDLGAWHLIALNSNCVSDSNHVSCQPGSEQITWLQQDLATHANKCTLVYMHHPYYSTGTRQYPELKTIWQTLYNGGADVILDGHTHYYQRFYPQDPDGNRDDAHGVAEIVVGTGGEDLAGVSDTKVYKNLAVQNGHTFGIMKMVLHPTSYSFQFLPIAGQTFTDSGTGTCH
jgi:hypothetical protein